MAFSEDLSTFLVDFGQTVTLNGVAVTAIFDSPYAVGAGGVGRESNEPMLTLKTTDVPSSPVGKTAVVGGVNYKVAGHEPDGTGMSRLVLERAA